MYYSIDYQDRPSPLHGDAVQHDDYGMSLRSIAKSGARGKLIVSLDSLVRMSASPSLRCLMERVDEGIGRGGAGAAPR